MKLLDTIRKDAVCSVKDNTSKLLGLEDVIVKMFMKMKRAAA